MWLTKTRVNIRQNWQYQHSYLGLHTSTASTSPFIACEILYTGQEECTSSLFNLSYSKQLKFFVFDFVLLWLLNFVRLIFNLHFTGLPDSVHQCMRSRTFILQNCNYVENVLPQSDIAPISEQLSWRAHTFSCIFIPFLPLFPYTEELQKLPLRNYLRLGQLSKFHSEWVMVSELLQQSGASRSITWL